MVLYNSIEIGRRLLEAKEIVAYGEWGKWLKESVDYSQSTANNLMRIFEEYGADQITFLNDNAKSQALGNLSYTQAVALMGIPSEDREVFIAQNNIDDMSTRELHQAIKDKEKAEKEKADAILITKKLQEELEKERDEKFQVESKYWTSDKVLRDTQMKYQTSELNLQKEREDSKKSVKKILQLEKSISEAQDSGSSEEVEKLKTSLAEAENQLNTSEVKLQDLEKQLQEKPVDVTETIVEKIPDEVERELQELRQKISQNNGQSAVKFKVYFDELVKNFKNLLGTLEEIKATDSETYNKYKTAVSGLIDKMGERL